MRQTRILDGTVTKNTSGSKLIRHGDKNPSFEASLALIAAFGAGAKSLVLGFEGSPDNDTWFKIQSVDLTTASIDAVETKAITADCARQLLYCPTDWPYVRVTWALTSDNNATLTLDATAGADPNKQMSAHPPVPEYA